MSLKTDLDPAYTPETRPYWEGVEQCELRLCTCGLCDRCFFPPSNVCPGCASKETGWRGASGRATLYGFVVNPEADARWGIEGLGCEAGPFIAERNRAPGGPLPMNTNGAGLCDAHSGSYAVPCMQESIRRLRGEAEAQVEGVRTSLAHGWGGFWPACATVIVSNQT
ncbi:MAG: thiolase C-terminal domain-containing protein [Myxococcota bacterium]